MREIANNLLAAALIAVASSSLLGCGDDEGSDASPDAGPAPDRGGGGAGGTAAIEPLPDKTAGKSCAKDADCGNGMCLLMVPGAFGGPAMEAPGGYCSATCMTNADCGEGGACSGAFAGFGGVGATPGRCVKSCTSATDCRAGYRCVNALGMPVTAGGMQDLTGGLLGGSGCEPIPPTDKLADGVVGSACAEAADCKGGRCQTGTATMTYPGGYCTGSCVENADCGANGTCQLPFSGAGTCYRNCGADSDCREGYRCRPSAGVMQCVPGAAPLADGVAGSECSMDADCGGAAMSCATSLGNAAAPGGYCSLACIDDSDCGSRAACVGGLGAALGGLLGPTGVCYAACSEASDCREGYTCRAAAGGFGATSTQTVCSVTPPSAEDAGVE